MNITNSLLCKKNILPKNWFISVPNLYGTSKFYDIMSHKMATFPGSSTQKACWDTYSNKPGAFCGSPTSTFSSIPCSIDYILGVSSKYTISLWIKPLLMPTLYGTILRFVTPALYLYNDGLLKYIDVTTSTGIKTLTINKWHHICLVSSGSTTEPKLIYIDGVLDISHTSTTVAAQTLRSSLNLYNLTGTSNYQLYGSIDDVMIFNEVLGPESIQNIYKSSFNRNRFNFKIFCQSIASSNSSLFHSLFGGQL